MRYLPYLCSVYLGIGAASARAAKPVTYETRDADGANDLPCYRLTLGPMLDQDGTLERDGVYRGSDFILRSKDGDDCTHFIGEAAYDDHHSFFIDITMDAACRIPLRFHAELKGRHDPDGRGYGVALCKKLRRYRDRRR